MPTPQRATQPSDLIDWSVVHEDVYDLAPDWQQPRPDVAGLRTREEVERLRTYLMAGYRFRADPLAPRLLTDRGQRVVRATSTSIGCGWTSAPPPTPSLAGSSTSPGSGPR